MLTIAMHNKSDHVYALQQFIMESCQRFTGGPKK